MQLLLLFIPLFLFVGYASLIIYYRQSWNSIPDFRFQISDFIPSTKISIIIPARNEEENIKNCLDSICNQSYPKNLFQIIVVDDHSVDSTATIVLNYPAENIQLISLKDFTKGQEINSYKKKAIEIAIEKCTGDLIITTDADCIAKKDWLITIAAFYKNTNAAFIAAPVAYRHEDNFLKIFQSLDFMTLQGITGAAVFKKIHSMCNGANLAYEKKVFYEVNGFKGIDNIASGDDMLLMHKIYSLYPDRVHFLKSSSAIVSTTAMDTLQSFFNQRIRWASKADKYDDKRITGVLVIVYFFNLVLLCMLIAAIFFSVQISIVNCQLSILEWWLALLLAKTIVELFFLFPVAKFFSKEKLLWWFPLSQPFHILYTVIAGWLGKFGSYRWKERKVK